jgi:hypothetical protein
MLLSDDVDSELAVERETAGGRATRGADVPVLSTLNSQLSPPALPDGN